MSVIIFVASARDYHAMDWFHSIKSLCPNLRIAIATDLIEGEGFSKIVSHDDEVLLLFPLDKFLLSDQSGIGNLWRNIIKLAILPLLAFKLRSLSKSIENAVFHAHSMYYIMLCWLAGIKFIGTPMGSDVLVRPEHSRIYRFFTVRSLRAASVITVDSIALQEKIIQLCGVLSVVIQNGIDTNSTRPARESRYKRSRVLSIRGCAPNYRILELLKARNRSALMHPLNFIYPFQEREYHDIISSEFKEFDQDYGRVEKERMYQLLSDTLLVISIPTSDSSPRSVYEAIFSGCCVAVSYGKWIEGLPKCMLSRLFVVDLESQSWFEDAILFAENVTSIGFVPSVEAIKCFDEIETMKSVCRQFYGVTKI